MSVEARTEFIPGDPILIRDIISQLKSQGVFDQFRKECISDVDTKPAYQNLCHRVDGQVSSYLSDIRWGPDLNKNQLRENIRKFVNKCTFVEPGISRIVDQLVNPRINTVLVPKVEDIVYQYVGMPPIERHLPNESSHDSTGNHKFDSQNSSFDKSWSSSSSYKRNEPWLRSPSNKFENYSHSKMDSSSSLPSLFDLKVEPPDEMKEKNEDSRMDFFPSEGGDDDNSRAYSTIDSDEDNLNDDVEEPSPSFEAFDLPDTYNSASADSDYPAELADSKNDSIPGVDVDEKSSHSHVEHTDENTNTDTFDDRSSQVDAKVITESTPAQFDVPKTPTINYETSEDSDDANGLKVNDALEEALMDQGPLADDIPDFSSVDKIAQKIAEDNREKEKMVSGDDERLKNGDCDRQKTVVESTAKPKEDRTDKPKEDRTDKHHKDDEKGSRATDASAKESKNRDRKYSEHRKDRHKSDKRDNSRDNRERKHREKERSSHDSSRSKSLKSRTESCDKTRKSSDEKELVDDEALTKSKSKTEHKSHRSHDERKSRDEKKQKSSSDEKGSKDDRSKRSRSDDGRDDRKKSRHDPSKDAKKSSQEEEKTKLKKPDGAETKDTKKSVQEDGKLKLKKPDSGESKKSGKSKCSTDEKKVRTDRRSSDRDSNGPSSSSNLSHHRSTSKSDKERHSEKSRHSSSLSSASHKSKKSDSKSVSSDRHCDDGCENSDVSKHQKEHSHHEKRKEEKVSSKTTADRRDAEQMPKDTASFLDCKGLEDAKHKEHPHQEKKKREKVSMSSDHYDAELPKEPLASGELDLRRQEEAKNVKISHPSPAKRSLAEMNSKEVTSELPGDGQLPRKMSENNMFNIKKPKIARNESEFGKVVRLRKEYKERMRLLQQQGKENNSESCQENDEKQVAERLSPVPMLKEATQMEPKVAKESKVTKEPKAAKELEVVSAGITNGLIKDLKLSITRVDSCYKIVDGSCLVSKATGRDVPLVVETSSILPQTETKKPKLVIKPVLEEKPDKLIKLKICRSISPTSGKERTKCVRSSTRESERDNPTGALEEPSPVCKNETTNLGSNVQSEELVFYLPSENEDVDEEPVNEEDQFRQMNIEEIIGCRTDCTRISYDLNGEKNVCEAVEAAKEQVADKNVVLFDEHNKENVGTESHCVNDTNRLPKRSSPDVLYFEPASPTNEFTRFIKKLVRDSEDVSLPEFSIQLDYPREYDAIFQSQLGASVRRLERVDHVSAGYAESTSSMTEILPESGDTVPNDELKPADECSGSLNAAAASKCDSSHEDPPVAAGPKVKIACTTKRKTLGIKRRISSISGSPVCRSFDSTDSPIESMVVSKVASAGVENNAKKKSSDLSVALPIETSCLNTYSHELQSVPEVCVPRLPIISEEDQKNRIYSSFNNNVSESSSFQVPIPAKTSKKPRKNSPLRSSDELLTEIVPKRTPNKNKCYYDNSDLYKPRPSFLASSRRSRALNPESK